MYKCRYGPIRKDIFQPDTQTGRGKYLLVRKRVCVQLLIIVRWKRATYYTDIVLYIKRNTFYTCLRATYILVMAININCTQSLRWFLNSRLLSITDYCNTPSLLKRKRNLISIITDSIIIISCIHEYKLQAPVYNTYVNDVYVCTWRYCMGCTRSEHWQWLCIPIL